jgi:hypothetical protein
MAPDVGCQAVVGLHGSRGQRSRFSAWGYVILRAADFTDPFMKGGRGLSRDSSASASTRPLVAILSF